MISPSAAARTTIAARKIRLSLTLIKKHMAMLHTSINGALTAILSIIW